MEVEMDIAKEEDNEKAFREASDEIEDDAMESETEKKTDENVEKIESDDSDDEEEADETEVKSLQTALTENPYDYATHVALINKLRTMGELDRLRVARNNMSNVYPLSPELWLSWIRDEIMLATTTEQKVEVTQLCDRAVKDYMSVEVWLEYLQFSIGNMGTEKDAAKNVRQLFERALTAVGLHTIKGAIIWEAFREFEIVLFALIDTANIAEKKEQLGRIGDLFRRQLACPLLDMEKTHEEYQLWRAGDGAEASIDDKSVSIGYEHALAKLNSLLPYEEKLVSAQGENELLDAYKGYLLHEKQQRDPKRIIVLYERAITDLSLEATIWHDYLTYLEDVSKTESVIDPIYQRATRNIPWCSRIWQKWLRLYEKWTRPILEVQKILENALAVSFSTAEDYRNLWIVYLEYLRRRIEQSSDEEKDRRIDVIRNTFNRACEHLAKYFGLDGDPNCIILQYWARTEAIHANNMEKARTLWADILSQGHSATASYWLEYISLERCYGDTKHLRKLFQKALSVVKDWPESIANAWIDFERDEGTLEQMELCEVKTKEKLDKVMEERQKQQETCRSELPTQNKKANKRKLDDSGKWKNLGGSPSKIVKSSTHEKLLLRESRLNKLNYIDNTEDKHKKEEAKPKIEAPPFGLKKTEDVDNTSNQPEIDNNITVFVSNLDYTATEDEVKDVMKSAGPITLFKMIKDYKGRSKGYCYVQLSSTKAVEEALKLDRTPIKGRPMFVSRCDPNKSTRSSGFKYSSTLEKNKLFVKGLPLTTTKEQLEEIFKVYGDLKEVRLVTYRNGHSKGLAYVEYHDEAIAAKALFNTDGMKIQDKVINVAISQPPDRKKIQTTEESGKQIKSLGGTTTSRTAFGVPKTLLSMVPRNVKTNNRNGAAPNGNGIAQSMSNQEFRNMLFDKK
ncbi:squamous cell carcinoma antigen recognized by T-cells 3-like [Pseudomyrmex gracilis]|uniref:squamous cell carcinoma antigen recognized by T-cells 3-like n=1 Tax=Pseudomyrmex gracilis TaxID=219809 RepID=UPI0009950957|nr:squamous cell carcinoma antigen recognized by T-cells 3-like [Pseudomyrmex gracilis]XP_020299616.1 squamous cell carcinoma antigen recognized by T-cells 3-like [Pseudomyrmex gracilis]XP_020299617.1 squamous cell carcinoma antigen recognized by T-cells 3-like [Pseudomyrmex gracilis]